MECNNKENLIRSLFRLRDENVVSALAEKAELRSYPAGQKLFGIGAMHQMAVFLLEGIAQGEYFDEGNRRHVMGFYSTRGYPLVTTSTTHKTVNAVYATTAMETLEIPLTVLAPLLEQSVEMLWVYNQLLNWAVVVYLEFSMMLRMSAVNRYAWMRSTLPGVDEQAAAKDISSFLAISPETLSRLRKQFSEQPLPRVTGTMYDAQNGRGMEYLKSSAQSSYHQYGISGAVEDLAGNES